MTNLRIVFLGTPDFAVASLRKLIEHGCQIVGVITAPDRMGGRGRKQVIESPVKKYAQQEGLHILQPKNLKAPSFVEELRSLKADLQIVVAFRMLPVIVWDMPRLGTYNLHGSLLPAYRGAAPINWAVMNGEEQTGVTTFKLKHEIDTGSMAFQRSVPIHKIDNVGDVHDRMMVVGAELIVETVQAIANETIQLREQEESQVSKAPKIYSADCEIDMTIDIQRIYHHIRGLSPYPGAWMQLFGSKTKIFKCTYSYQHHGHPIGQVISDGRSYLGVYTKNGVFFVEELQTEGRRRMSIDVYLNGAKLESNKSADLLIAERPW